MPIPIPEALEETAALARTKAAQVRRLPGYLLSSAMAGAYVGVAVVLLVSVAGPLAASGSAATKLAQGAVFGVALTLVVFAGAELFTGNVMFMPQGLHYGTVRRAELAAVWVASLGGNFAGSIAFAALVTPEERWPATGSSPRSSRPRTPPPAPSCSGGRCCATCWSAWRCGWRPGPEATERNSSWCGGRCWPSSAPD